MLLRAFYLPMPVIHLCGLVRFRFRLGYFRRGDYVTVCAGFIPQSAHGACAGIITPRVSGADSDHHKVRYRVLLRRALTQQRPYRFCTGFIPKALLSLRRNYRPTPPNPTKEYRRIPITTKPVPTVHRYRSASSDLGRLTVGFVPRLVCTY
jgi:hypothetical protein